MDHIPLVLKPSSHSLTKKIILGIDPGTNATGYGVIDVQGCEVQCVAMGYIDLSKYPDHYTKLRYIFERVVGLIEVYMPDEVAFESPFFGENVQSMLKLGRAQGVAMAAALTHGLPVFEYAPRKVKQSITGKGAASKEQVAGLLKGILKLETLPKKLDATDGLAVAMCHHYESSAAIRSGKGGSWKDFVAKNPERIR